MTERPQDSETAFDLDLYLEPALPLSPTLIAVCRLLHFLVIFIGPLVGPFQAISLVLGLRALHVGQSLR